MIPSSENERPRRPRDPRATYANHNPTSKPGRDTATPERTRKSERPPHGRQDQRLSRELVHRRVRADFSLDRLADKVGAA